VFPAIRFAYGDYKRILHAFWFLFSFFLFGGGESFLFFVFVLVF